MGDELAFAQQEFIYLNSLDVTKDEPGAIVATVQLTIL
ncbi:hypothetical protein HJ01_02067 [Flavobacterium frigoris PS1]|uniref:Uncharacterized protein n=1 Tax=Flavobacterium frigoris (strain PS1) TaxID=1086011 RepID=H7FTE1_FLAFP|nr:hypothetical protein HJ01_02067 [Flavobacterium frigoris PS1]